MGVGLTLCDSDRWMEYVSSVGHWTVGGRDVHHLRSLIGTSGFLAIAGKSLLRKLFTIFCFYLWNYHLFGNKKCSP